VASSWRAAVPEPLKQAAREARRLVQRLVPRPPPVAVDVPVRPSVPAAPRRLLVGPVNSAGQAWAWARAAEREIPGVVALAMSVRRGGLEFDCDYGVPVPAYLSGGWGADQERWIASSFTHVLIDSMKPLMGSRYGEDCLRELPVLRRAGIDVALVAHGSDIRVPSRHATLYPTSPFADPPPDQAAYVRRLEHQASRLGRILDEFDGPTFVSTPDLLDFAPRARLLPVVVDPDVWATARPALRRRRPVVLHAPGNGLMKGSGLLDPLLGGLDARGVIEYRRVRDVPPADMPALVADADVLVDQVVLGLYSATAVQGLAAGRLVVAHVPERVRARVPGGEVPIADATAATIVELLEQVAADPDGFAPLAAQGPAFARRVHDGRLSARVIALGFGWPVPPDDDLPPLA
jgi:hypothetical protein